MKIPTTSSVNKFELVRLISEHSNEAPPNDVTLYSGNLKEVPTTQRALSRLSVAKLHAVLHWHNIYFFGNKAQLILRVQLLRAGRTATMFRKEEAEIRETVDIINELILEERRMVLLQSPVYTSRKYATSEEYDTTLSISDCLLEEDGWIRLFDGLLSVLDNVRQRRMRDDENNTIFSQNVVAPVAHNLLKSCSR